ncbi:hypothetical protein B0H19DRAFT_1296089 [Mycena capillaripes]|nr:hypothetical protein B0H19DRAFT_1296089 [Mycena capillaripes]
MQQPGLPGGPSSNSLLLGVYHPPRCVVVFRQFPTYYMPFLTSLPSTLSPTRPTRWGLERVQSFRRRSSLLLNELLQGRDLKAKGLNSLGLGRQMGCPAPSETEERVHARSSSGCPAGKFQDPAGSLLSPGFGSRAAVAASETEERVHARSSSGCPAGKFQDPAGSLLSPGFGSRAAVAGKFQNSGGSLLSPGFGSRAAQPAVAGCRRVNQRKEKKERMRDQASEAEERVRARSSSRVNRRKFSEPCRLAAQVPGLGLVQRSQRLQVDGKARSRIRSPMADSPIVALKHDFWKSWGSRYTEEAVNGCSILGNPHQDVHWVIRPVVRPSVSRRRRCIEGSAGVAKKEEWKHAPEIFFKNALGDAAAALEAAPRLLVNGHTRKQRAKSYDMDGETHRSPTRFGASQRQQVGSAKFVMMPGADWGADGLELEADRVTVWCRIEELDEKVTTPNARYDAFEPDIVDRVLRIWDICPGECRDPGRRWKLRTKKWRISRKASREFFRFGGINQVPFVGANIPKSLRLFPANAEYSAHQPASCHQPFAPICLVDIRRVLN